MLIFSTVFYLNAKREGGDINTIKNYFYDAEQVSVKKGDTCYKYNAISNNVMKEKLVERVNTGIWYDVCEIKSKHVFSTLIDMRLSEGKSIRVSVCGFPCIAIDGRLIAVDASLYLALLEGGACE